jgi:hypothetical protein
MTLSNSIPSTHSTAEPASRQDQSPAETRDIIAGVAHALWVERKRRHLPDDPEADWYRAEQLIEELRSHRPPDAA